MRRNLTQLLAVTAILAGATMAPAAKAETTSTLQIQAVSWAGWIHALIFRGNGPGN